MKVKKGDYGYIKFSAKKEVIKTLFMIILCIAIYELGIYSTGSNSNLLTYVAVLGCLPMAKFCVNAIMFLKAKGCSKELKDELEQKNLSPLYYDLFFTAFKKNYQVSALEYKKKNLIMISEDSNISVEEGEQHIKELLGNAGYKDLTVKIYTDKDKFIERLTELNSLPEEEKDLTFLFDNILGLSL